MSIIHIICNDGSPLKVTLKDLYGEGNQVGVGGSEYALLTMCEEWHKAGHEVILYNDPKTPNGSPFEQRMLHEFDPAGNRDVLIIFRSPNARSLVAGGCLKIWWSCDQETVGNFAHFAGTVNKIVCISPRHAQYFAERYGITNTTVIDIPVRMEDFDNAGDIEKVKNRLIFTSVPGRGLDNLFRIYPLIQQAIPGVSLAITSDYRLWGVPASNEHFISQWGARSNVIYFGALPRRQYVEELLRSQITLYPSNYDELFCVAIAESQYAGSYPITSATGALPTTNMGTVLNLDANNAGNDRAYADKTIMMLNDVDLLKCLQKDVHDLAKERFSPKRILEEWDRVFND
jgi:glycosyltransferase involved in cell wall biosynthesis